VWLRLPVIAVKGAPRSLISCREERALSHWRRALMLVNYRPHMEGSRMFFLNGASED
jgi:hypothetical protein